MEKIKNVDQQKVLQKLQKNSNFKNFSILQTKDLFQQAEFYMVRANQEIIFENIQDKVICFLLQGLVLVMDKNKKLQRQQTTNKKFQFSFKTNIKSVLQFPNYFQIQTEQNYIYKAGRQDTFLMSIPYKKFIRIVDFYKRKNFASVLNTKENFYQAKFLLKKNYILNKPKPLQKFGCTLDQNKFRQSQRNFSIRQSVKNRKLSVRQGHSNQPQKISKQKQNKIKVFFKEKLYTARMLEGPNIEQLKNSIEQLQKLTKKRLYSKKYMKNQFN